MNPIHPSSAYTTGAGEESGAHQPRLGEESNGTPASYAKGVNDAPLDFLRPSHGAVVVTVGPELPQHGDSVLKDGVQNIVSKYGAENTQVASLRDVRNGGPLPKPGPNDTVYLVGHGEDPGHSDVKSPDLGGMSASQLTNDVLKRVFKDYGNKNHEQFEGKIVLEGCHTGVPTYEGNKRTGPSLLDSVQNEMMTGKNGKFFKGALAPEAKIAGYHGPSYDDPDHATYGKAEVESPEARQRLGVKGQNPMLSGKDAVEERRVWQKPSYKIR